MAETRSCASTRPRASKVETSSVSVIGRVAASRRSTAAVSGSKSGLGELVLIARALIHQEARDGVGIAQVQQGQARGLGQLPGTVGRDGQYEGVVRIQRRLLVAGAPDLQLRGVGMLEALD